MRRSLSYRGAVVWMLASLSVACGETPREETAADAASSQSEWALLNVGDEIPGRYIVTLRPGVARSALSGRSAGPSVAVVAETLRDSFRGTDIIHVYENALEGFAIRLDPAEARAMARDPWVARITEDRVAGMAATQSNPANWGLDRIDQRNLPLDKSYTYTSTASSVHAYILDTGLRVTHTEFTGRVGDGHDAVGGGINDCQGHGTHVAGILGGKTYGVAKGVTIHPVRVLDCAGNAPWSTIIAGVDWVTANAKKPAVANMSISGSADASIDDAIRNSMTRTDILYFIAAGNNTAQDACKYSPARTTEAFILGATNSNDSRLGMSNIGTCLDLYAPGGSVISAHNTSDTATNTLSGTSMAAPHTAGVAATILAENPSFTRAQVADKLVSLATVGKVTDAGAGSPNRLLYSVTGGTPDCTPTETKEQTCNDGKDNDCDALIDRGDPDCPCIADEPNKETKCADGFDNDCDGKIDLADADCPQPCKVRGESCKTTSQCCTPLKCFSGAFCW